MPKCIVKNCPSKTGGKERDSHVVLHTFPRDLENIKIWLQQTNQDFGNLEDFSQKVLEGKKNDLFRMCSKHFTSESYTIQGARLVLKKDASPTIFPSMETSDIDPSTVGPPRKRFRPSSLDEVPSTSVLTGTPCRPIPLDAHTQTYVRVRTLGVQSNPKRGMRSVAIQTEPECFTRTIGVQTGSSEENTINTASTWLRSNVEILPLFVPGTVFTPMKAIATHGIATESDVSLVQPLSPVLSSINITDDTSFLDKTDQSVIDEDSDYIPTVSKLSNAEETIDQPPTDHLKERKFIVFESCLDSLLYRTTCNSGLNCSSPIDQLFKRTVGSFLTVSGKCISGHSFHIWDSQPRVNQVAMGNYLLSAAVLCSGSNFNKVHDLFKIVGIQQISKTNYYRYQRRFLFPSIDLHWQKEYEKVKSEMKGKALCVSGDGQYDSSRHNAKFCTYSIMDLKSQKILDFKILQIEKKKKSSVGLEKEAFQKCLDSLLMQKLDIQIVTTDRQVSINKLMHEGYSDISHQFDIWHFSKSLKKKTSGG
ncbi:uncharacterized protein WCC33_010403 isoform 1-T1 [Rhinophrynus dorsalis]